MKTAGMKRAWLVTGLVLGMSAGALRAQTPEAEHQHDHMGSKPSVASANLTVTVDGKVTTFSAADLKQMPQKTITVKNGHTGAEESYSGVAVSDLLMKCGLAAGPGKKVYHSYVRAEGTDGYWVLFSASELEGLLNGDDAVIAIAVDGKPLDGEGAFKMVATAEKKPARWVRNLATLTVVAVE
jgi:hypothetical protein